MGIREAIQRWTGRKRIKPADLTSLAPGAPTHIFWAMRDLPIKEATQHFLVAGSPQSGKTITIRQLKQSIIPYVGRGYGHRAFVYDAKRELLPVLAEMWGQQPITLDPFDARGHPWDMAKDIKTEADAGQLAGMLIPDEPNTSQRYFPDAARDLMRAVLVAFIETAPERWTFRDVLFTMEDPQRLVTTVRKSEPSTRIAAHYLRDKSSLPSVLSTISTKMQFYRTVAGLWGNSTQAPLSLAEWLDTEGVLVVVSHPCYSESLRPLTQALFRRLSDLVLSRPDTDPREPLPWRTWFFLDEVRDAGQLSGLQPLLNMGRSKGACMVLGFQDIAGMQAVYGDKIADELAGQCAYKTMLRTGSQVTGLWAQTHFGQAEHVRPKFSESESYDMFGSISGFQKSVSYDYVVENAMLASELQSIPAPGPETGLIGFHDTPGFGSYRSQAPWDWVMNNLWQPSEDVLKAVPKVIARSPEEQKLRPWTDEDYDRLWPGETRKKEVVKKSKSRREASGSEQREESEEGITRDERRQGILTLDELGAPIPPVDAGELADLNTAPEPSTNQAKKLYEAKKRELFSIERTRA